MAEGKCRNCGGRVDADPVDAICPHCGDLLVVDRVEASAEAEAPARPGPSQSGASVELQNSGPPSATRDTTGRAGEASPRRCECVRGGGPAPDDRTKCFLCGGLLTETDRPRDDRGGDGPTGENPASAPEEARLRAGYLVLDDGRQVRVDDTLLVVRGNAEESRARVVAIPERSVSRKHAWLRVTATGMEVMDLLSTNGTLVGNRRIEPLQVVAVDRDVELSFGRSGYHTLMVGPLGSDRGVRR